MSALGPTSRERLGSRVIFYTLVVAALLLMDRLVPNPAEAEAARWEALGVARPYFAVPMGEVERILQTENR